MVRLVRAALRCALSSYRAEVGADLKNVHQADSAVEAEDELESLAGMWDAKYPTIARHEAPRLLASHETMPAVGEQSRAD